MENASKALLIAGTVLIAIIMISTAVYLYTAYSKQVKEYDATISATELQKFNSKFDVYVGRDDITPQEIVSVVNLAKEYGNQVQIYIGFRKLEFTESYTQEDFIKSTQDKTFKCTLAYPYEPKYDANGKITRLSFRIN